MSYKQWMKQQIQQHAKKQLAGRGKVEIKNFHREAHHYGATVVLTTPDGVERYRAFVSDGAVGMVKVREGRLRKLPLFSE